MDDWIKKTWYVRIIKYYLAMIKDEILLFATKQMKLEDITLGKVSQTLAEKHQIFSYLWWLTNAYITKVLTISNYLKIHCK